MAVSSFFPKRIATALIFASHLMMLTNNCHAVQAWCCGGGSSSNETPNNVVNSGGGNGGNNNRRRGNNNSFLTPDNNGADNVNNNSNNGADNIDAGAGAAARAAAGGGARAAVGGGCARAAAGGKEPLVKWGLNKGLVPMSSVIGTHGQGNGTILPYANFGKDVDRASAHPGDEPRRAALMRTLDRVQCASAEAHYHKQAALNLTRWHKKVIAHRPENILKYDRPPQIICEQGDWGVVTQQLTEQFGETFAVLNMANAYGLGGGYQAGMKAQEENMWRRSDCHWSHAWNDPNINAGHVIRGGYNPAHPNAENRGRYSRDETKLILSRSGRCYLDVVFPRVCVTGPEDIVRNANGEFVTNWDNSYQDLPVDQMFPFYELRSAAPDLRPSQRRFDKIDMQNRIGAQLTTMREKGVRNVVLSAFRLWGV